MEGHLFVYICIYCLDLQVLVEDFYLSDYDAYNSLVCILRNVQMFTY